MTHSTFINFLWDPSRDIFVIPYLNHPITWYGFLFAFGFVVGYFLVRHVFMRHLLSRGMPIQVSKLKSVTLSDRLTLLVVIGTIVGARLGHVFFYEWDYYSRYPLSIIKVWEGGLASHGGAIGILLALVIFTLWSKKQYASLTFLAVLDVVMIPTAFVSGCIRIGNFINQEILGTPTTLPWGVIFKHPVQSVAEVPLHPVQLYEALAFFLIFSFLLFQWKRSEYRLGKGLLAGWFFVLVFGFRFLVEFIKLPQNSFETVSPLKMGQILSLPFIIVGIILLFRAYRNKV